MKKKACCTCIMAALCLAFSLFSGYGSGQTHALKQNQAEHKAPPFERPDYLLSALTAGNPPPAPVRQPAEFEPMEGVLIRFPFGISSYELIAEMAEDVEVKTIVLNAHEHSYVESQYLNHGGEPEPLQLSSSPFRQHMDPGLRTLVYHHR